MDASGVPTIDLAPFLHGGDSDRSAVARAIDAACIEVGFFAVTGHGVAEDAVEALRAAAVRFFALPEGDKVAVRRPPDRISRGWNHLGDRSLAYSLGKETPPDLQESFAMGPPAVPAGAYYECARAHAFFAPNLWPAALPELRPLMEAYFRTMVRLAGTLMQAFALALGLPAAHFEDKIDRHTSSLRLIRYPGRAAARDGQRRAGEHTDYGSLTILRGDNRPGGLQVRLRRGDWVEVARPEGGFICNVGDTLARWSNDRWVSTLHRVGLPPSGVPDGDRLSIAFFHNPNYDAEISCIARPGDTARYPAEAFDAYYLDKLRRGSFGKDGGAQAGLGRG